MLRQNINRRLNPKLDESLDRPYGLLFSGTPPRAKPTPAFWNAWRTEENEIESSRIFRQETGQTLACLHRTEGRKMTLSVARFDSHFSVRNAIDFRSIREGGVSTCMKSP